MLVVWSTVASLAALVQKILVAGLVSTAATVVHEGTNVRKEMK